MKSGSSILFVTIYLINFVWATEPKFDPYSVLNVKRSSSADEIRKQYKKLAREWHPDKNKDPDAGDKFTQINKAYEILGDEKRKDQYDRFGKIDDNQQSGGSQSGQFFRTPFGDFQFPGEGFRWDSDENVITDRLLQNHILPESYEKPYFFFATTDFCFNCMRVQPIWKQFTRDLETLDIGFGVVDADYQMSVAKRLRIPRVPCIGAIVNGRSVIFDSGQYSINVLRQFMRKLLPDDLLQQIDANSVDSFLSGWKDNKVRVIFFGAHALATMRLLVPLYQVRNHISATYVDTRAADSAQLLDRFDVETSAETLLIFKEDVEHPVHVESQKKFSTVDLLATFKANKYLSLPRISSPAIYNDLCPANGASQYKQYCVMLTFDSSLADLAQVRLFREFARKATGSGNIKFAHVYTDKQKMLTEVWGRPPGDFQVVVIVRKKDYRVDLSWVEWCGEGCEGPLESVMTRLSTGSYKFTDQSVRRYDIRDEMAASLIVRIVRRIRDWWDHFTYTYFDGDHSLTIISILSTTVCVVIITFAVGMVFSSAPTSTPASFSTAPTKKSPQSGYAKSPGKFTVYDMRSHNYDKLITDSPPGYRLILLFVDEGNKKQYIKRFADLMMPFNRAPYFIFGFIYIDKYLSWYQRLLAQTVGFKEELRNISAQNCIGTVLAINGHRKYYSIYHPKTLNVSARQRQDGYAFVGLEDSSDSEQEGMNGNGHTLNGQTKPMDGDSLIAAGRLLDGLSHWVDRLFDGTLPKCKIQSWPVFPVDQISERKLNENKKEQ
ncbi:dnaJ homolog subfamily C member 16-like [Watersipora subatra]|uniref:dnaJ homolog subfamily C member 16-like n=1 Tax=Watersipora subatra TaxID=2589382 RepID=UPI00355C987D